MIRYIGIKKSEIVTNIQILSLIKTTFTENSLKCHGTLTSSQYLRTVFKSQKKVLEIEPNYCKPVRINLTLNLCPEFVSRIGAESWIRITSFP